MAASSDVTLTEDGVGNVKLHPYLITLVRWCVSCLWSTASVLLHRLVTAPLPPISATKAVPRLASKPRQAGTEHLHPEPKVQCVVLHTPPTPTLDVIFVHGLYGSLGNTWRQGDWGTKYKINPTKISLRNHTTNECSCHMKQEPPYINYYETNLNETEINETVSFNQINGCFNKILPNENSLITEKFTNTFLNGNVNYETQAEFVSDLFKASNKTYDLNVNINKCNCICKVNEICKLNECNCKVNEGFRLNKCDIGCGCVCDDCYSSCWPKDWIKEDFPGARVISINYTSDPYLWRPLWVKGNKRLRLHERAEQMIEQLLSLGVGQRPVIWVGHSKGGLFIKQIYCEAYDAYLKTNKGEDSDNKINNNLEDQSNLIKNNLVDNYNNFVHNTIENVNETDKNDTNANKVQNINEKKKLTEKIENLDLDVQNFNNLKYKENICTEKSGCAENGDVIDNKQTRLGDIEYIDISIHKTEKKCDNATIGKISKGEKIDDIAIMSSSKEEDIQVLRSRSSLWIKSAGFMFYSVPHRGSPLAAIKTPITARSIELLEISKDCELVLELQDRWLVATRSSRPAVRSLVETCRTLMSVLWLRIVSVDSADAGIGSLHGVAVDHREICKPSSRKCLLYTELTGLIKNALYKCDCKNNKKPAKCVSGHAQ